MKAESLQTLRNSLKSYDNFPKKGILFMDIFSILSKPDEFEILNNLLKQKISELEYVPDVIVGLDARGFIFGPILALAFNIPFVPIRKKGKLPGEVSEVSYGLEYGKDTMEIQKDSIKSGSKVVIVDDLLATGGTMGAAITLVESLGAEVILCLVCIELVELKGREKCSRPVATILEC